MIGPIQLKGEGGTQNNKFFVLSLNKRMSILRENMALMHNS